MIPLKDHPFREGTVIPSELCLAKQMDIAESKKIHYIYYWISQLNTFYLVARS